MEESHMPSFTQLSAWLAELKGELSAEDDVLAATAAAADGSAGQTTGPEAAERLLEQFSAQRESTLDALASTLAEGKTLVEELK